MLEAHNDAGSFLEKTPEELDADSVFAQTVDRSTVQGEGSNSEDTWQNLLTPSDDPERLGDLGPYEISELVGRGGMGVVLRAHEPKLSRTVAVKLLAPELALNPVAVQRFLREARAAAAVSHDHVVAIHSIDDESHPPVIVMEFIQGQSLQQKIDKVGALDVKSILRIGMQTAAGLAAAHRQGLVHRDVKPANILLENGIERVKLTDFGLARAVEDISMTRTGQITGTPQYMSPEQAQGQRVDHRTDLFSLGCVLYAMCTGRAAFRADSAVAVMHRVVHDAPRPIREVNEDVPDWLCEIVDKLLAKEAEDRFASAEEVEDLLSRHLAHLQQPTNVARPERLGSRAVTAATERDAVEADASEMARSSDHPPIPKWLLWKFPAWTPLVLIGAMFGIKMFADYGPESLPGSAELNIIFTLVVLMLALPLGILMLIRKLLRARYDLPGEQPAKNTHTGFWTVLFVLLPLVAAGFASGMLGLKGPSAQVVAVLAGVAGAVFLLKARRSMQGDDAATNTPDYRQLDKEHQDRLGRHVDISEEFEKELQSVGVVLLFVCIAAMMAPLGTYLISDQIEVPYAGSLLAFFMLTTLIVLPISMRASLDLNWLPITRRRPGPAMLTATALAVIPWNPLLLLMLPWTISAYRRVRRSDVLELIGVSEDDPRVKSVFATGQGLFRKPAFVILFAVIVLTVAFWGEGQARRIRENFDDLFGGRTGTEVSIPIAEQPQLTEARVEPQPSDFFKAFTTFAMVPEQRSETWKLITPYVAGEPVTSRGESGDGSNFVEWKIESGITGTSQALRTTLPAFRDYIQEIAKETGARITKTTPTDGEGRAGVLMEIEYLTPSTRGTIEIRMGSQMKMTDSEFQDLHGLQMVHRNLRFEIQEQQF